MAHSGIEFQEPLTSPGVKLDEKMSICSSTPQDQAGIQIPACWRVILETENDLHEPNEQFVERLSLYERKQILLLNNLTTESTMYALKMLNRRTCVSNQDEKQGKSERSRTKSKLTSKYGVTRRDREPSRLQCKKVIKVFKKSKSCRRCIKHFIMYNTPHSFAMRSFLSIDFRRYVATRLCKSSPVGLII